MFKNAFPILRAQIQNYTVAVVLVPSTHIKHMQNQCPDERFRYATDPPKYTQTREKNVTTHKEIKSQNHPGEKAH